MQNFADVVRIFLAQDGAVQARNADELEKTLGELLANPARCAELGRNAQKIVRENQGAVARTVDLIVRQLEGGGFYVAPKRGE